MSTHLENVGFGFLSEDEEAAQQLATLIAAQGKPIMGYYGLPYINKHFGDVQFILRTDWSEDKERLSMSGIDTHCAGPCVWSVRVTGIDLTPKDADRTEKLLVVSKEHADSGLAPINIVNADVLPSYEKNEIVKLQVLAFPVYFDYFKNEAAYEESVIDDDDGRKLLLEEGHIFPNGMLQNRDPNNEEFEQNSWMDELVNIRGTVKRFVKGKVAFDDDEDGTDAFVGCIVDTEFGELEIVHSFGQVKEDQRNNLRVGATISGVFALSGDPAIYEYENGIVLDRENNMRLLRATFAMGDPDRLQGALATDAVYISEYNNAAYTGFEEISERLKFVHDCGAQFLAAFATITAVDDGDEPLPYPVGTRCIIISRDHSKNYETVVFMDMNEDGQISCIRTTKNARYHFRVDEPWHPTAEPEQDEEDEEDEEFLEVNRILELLVEAKNYATCELYMGDYKTFSKEG